MVNAKAKPSLKFSVIVQDFGVHYLKDYHFFHIIFFKVQI